MLALFVTAHIEPTGRSPWLDVGDEAARQPRGTSSLSIRPNQFSPGANDLLSSITTLAERPQSNQPPPELENLERRPRQRAPASRFPPIRSSA